MRIKSRWKFRYYDFHIVTSAERRLCDVGHHFEGYMDWEDTERREQTILPWEYCSSPLRSI